jgi:hypothetical protein
VLCVNRLTMRRAKEAIWKGCAQLVLTTSSCWKEVESAVR